MLESFHMRHLRHFIEFPFAILAIIIVSFEEYIWRYVSVFVTACRNNRYLNALGLFIQDCAPYIAATFFLIPIILLIPLKILAVFLLAHGHFILGTILYLAIKIIGATIAKWIYSYAQHSLRKIVWFEYIITLIMKISKAVKNKLHTNIYFVALTLKVNNYKKLLKSQKRNWLQIKQEKYTRFFRKKLQRTATVKS